MSTFKRQSCMGWFLACLVCLLSIFFSASAHAERLPEFLPKIAPSEIFPGANRYGKPEGKPMVARVYKDQEQLGFVYITTDLVSTRGYSSKPIDMMVAVANDGTIKGAKLVEHHEPIVLIGIPIEKVNAFIGHYIGLNFIKNPLKPGEAPADIISGATVTLMVINDSLQRSVKRMHNVYKVGTDQALSSNVVATQEESAQPQRVIDNDKQGDFTWEDLVQQKVMQELYLSVDDVNKLFEEFGGIESTKHPEKGPGTDTFIRMYAGIVSQPAIGKALLGPLGWENLKARLKPGQSAMVILGEGRYSFKGSGYVRGGIFDRMEIIQGDTSFRFIDLNHERLPALSAKGAPRYKEIGIFITPEGVNFNPAEPWRLQLMIQRVLSVKDKAFVTKDLNYTFPESFTKVIAPAKPAATPATQVATTQADAAVDDTAMAEEEPKNSELWKSIWLGKKYQIAVIGVALLLLIGVFFFQNTLVSYPKFYKRFRTCFLLFSVVYVGWYAQAQLSVVNVFTFTDSLRTGFSWEYFLMDPLVFIMWSATAISMLFWNRGAFCGWLCPFGSLQELLNQLARKLGIKQITLPYGVHTRLAAVKYVIFMGLFGVSLYSLGLAEKLAEVEPFKTAIILKFMRDWWFVLFAVALLVAGLFIERFYCRYMCPLGAALAIPAKLRIFDWLRRYKMCGDPCQRCANDCPVQAIHPTGEIDANECIQCLNCQMLYHHQTKCPHLVQKNKIKNKMANAKAELEAKKQLEEKQIVFVKKENLQTKA